MGRVYNRDAGRAGLLVFLLTAVALAPAAAHADVEGGSDHPLLPRFAGSEIIGYETSDYDEFTLALSSVEGVPEKKQKTVEGRITRILYAAPEGKSTLQVFRNYEKALKKTGASTLFSCARRAECGFFSWFKGAITMGGLREYADVMDNDFRYLAAHLPRETEGDVHVALIVYHVAGGPWGGRVMAELGVVESEPMETEMVVVKADDLAKGLAEKGHAAVRHIYFDTDSAAVRPESQPALDEIAKLLKNNPDLKIILVGHTDSQGGLQYNMDLSRKRAHAVMTTLESEYGIARQRLGAAGVGYLAPVASNRTEEGRARNRRVELVEQ